MENDERLSGALQENILTLLCFDDKNCKVLRAALTPQIFGNAVHREVAGHAIDFVDQYGEAIKEHLADHLEDILEGDDKRKAEAYRRLLDNLFQSRETVNADYTLSQLHKFVRQQNLKSSVIRAVEALEDGRIDDAEVELQKGLNNTSVAFEAGLSLNSADDINSILDNPEEEGFELGIPELDRRGIMPRRKELMLFVAPRGKGKSWFITHCAKQALLQRWSCVVITLEMGEKSYAARFLQAFFSISRREAEVRVTRFSKDREGDLVDIIEEKLTRPTMRDDDIRQVLTKRARQEFKRRAPLRIKAFPSGSLTIAGLEAYLDGLERFEKFTPDLICVDYPDLMETDTKTLRLDLGKIIVRLRGIAQKRNAALVAVSQGNRESETATNVTGAMVAEDISKLATADTVITYSQTLAEYVLGLARLFVEKARNEESKFSVLITQVYALGQFCLDSVRLGRDYFSLLGGGSEEDDERDDPREDERGRRRRDPAPARERAPRRRKD